MIRVFLLIGVSGIDDLWYDGSHQRIYASGGRGFEVGFGYRRNSTAFEEYMKTVLSIINVPALAAIASL